LSLLQGISYIPPICQHSKRIHSLPISKESILPRFGKYMIRKLRGFWRCISKGQGEKGWKGRLNTFVLGGGWQIQTSEGLANLRIGAPSILDF
jgi:hypothetical protein